MIFVSMRQVYQIIIGFLSAHEVYDRRFTFSLLNHWFGEITPKEIEPFL